MKLFRLLPVLALCLLIYNSDAQAILSIRQNDLDSLPSTEFLPSDTGSASVLINVYNISDSVNFTGNVVIKGMVNGNSLHSDTTGFNGAGIFYPITLNNCTIPFGGSISAIITFVLDTPQYLDGPSVVVIWPVGLNAITADSASWSLTVTSTAAINGLQSENLKVFVAEQQLWVQSTSQNLLDYVRIYGVTGALVASEKITGNTAIPINQYASGVYLAEVILTDNTKRLFKVFNPPPGGR